MVLGGSWWLLVVMGGSGWFLVGMGPPATGFGLFRPPTPPKTSDILSKTSDILSKTGDIRSKTVLGGSWWFLVVLGGSGWVLGGSWWVLGGSW